MTRMRLLAALLLVSGGCAAYDEQVLGNRYHRVACEDLPGSTMAEEVLRNRRDIAERILALRSDGSVAIELVEPCPGRAALVVRFPSTDVRQIEQLIVSSTFFGIPYDLVNV